MNKKTALKKLEETLKLDFQIRKGEHPFAESLGSHMTEAIADKLSDAYKKALLVWKCCLSSVNFLNCF